MRPRGRGGAQGSPRGAVQRGVRMQKEGEERRPDRQGDGRAARVGEGRKAGEGGGRESGGRKQCSRRGPGRVPLPNAATKVRFGHVAPAPGGRPGRSIAACGGCLHPTPRRLGGRRLAGREGRLARGRPRRRYRRGWPCSDPTPVGPRGRARGDAGVQGRRQARRRRWPISNRPSSDGRKLAGLARGSAARILRPLRRACARGPARRAAGRGPAPSAGPWRECGGCVRAHALPPLAGLREGSGRSLQRATRTLHPTCQPSLVGAPLLRWRLV